MSGNFLSAWQDTYSFIWEELAQHEDARMDLSAELYRELVIALKTPTSIEALADVIDDPDQGHKAFISIVADDFASEVALVNFMESVFSVLEDYAGDGIKNEYLRLLSNFISRFNLRYELIGNEKLCPTIPGIFSQLFLSVRNISKDNHHLKSLFIDFERSIHDLRIDQSEGRIKTCIQKQINLLEAIAKSQDGAKKHTLGDLCDEVGKWPHTTIREALKKIYGFSSDYPGIRHSGNPDGVIRSVDMNDLVSLTIVIFGFVPYLCEEIQGVNVYGGV